MFLHVALTDAMTRSPVFLEKRPCAIRWHDRESPRAPNLNVAKPFAIATAVRKKRPLWYDVTQFPNATLRLGARGAPHKTHACRNVVVFFGNTGIKSTDINTIVSPEKDRLRTILLQQTGFPRLCRWKYQLSELSRIHSGRPACPLAGA